jgi:hypothetical protein
LPQILLRQRQFATFKDPENMGSLGYGVHLLGYRNTYGLQIRFFESVAILKISFQDIRIQPSASHTLLSKVLVCEDYTVDHRYRRA